MTVDYLTNGNGGANSSCTPALGPNKDFLGTRSNTQATTRSVPALAVDEISMSWTSQAGSPNGADWPLGDYSGGVKSSSNPALGGHKIQLLRVNSACTVQQTLGTSTLFTGTGVVSFTVNLNPSAGAAGDRFQMRILGTNNSDTMAASLTLQNNTTEGYGQTPDMPAPPGGGLLRHPGMEGLGNRSGMVGGVRG
jgi:hypothetical protein